ncbi:acetate--CoA ligase family protein [Candidatus Woesearchaeota archaeon]|nr:acetate--CoA ligase family protein [Candidatus Woesearchaeota archaeon]
MRVMDFKGSVGLLKRYRLKPIIFASASNKDFPALKRQAVKIGYPCVLKLYAREILHKSMAGAVITGIRDEPGLVAAHKSMLEIIHEHHITRFELVLQPQVDGFEIIVGGKQDASFGPIVLFGFGGIYAEALRQTAIRICPITASQALEMIQEIPIPLDMHHKNQLADIISRVARLMEKEAVKELDFNPILINEDGCHIVDVRMLL